MTEHKLAHILRAIADGKVVQFKLLAYEPIIGRTTDLGWRDLDTSGYFSLFVTHPNMEYRIKPKPLVKKWRWLIDLSPKNSQSLHITQRHFSSKEAVVKLLPNCKVLQRMDETLIEEEED